MIRFGWTSWMLMATGVGAAPGLFTAARIPARYRSEALILVVPQRVPETYVRSTVTTATSDRVQSLDQMILSRARLEPLIEEFNLYPEERQRAVMEDVIENMRKNVDIKPQSDDSFRIGFVGTEPRTVMKVAERLAALFIQENRQHREQLAEGTNEFIQAQLENLRTRLVQHKQQLNAARHAGRPEAETMAIEAEVLEARFKDLLTKLEDSRMASNLEHRQVGEQFTLLDPPRVAEGPFSPDRRLYAGIGAVAGLAAGLLLSFVIRWTRSRGNARQQALPVEA